jgi:hypothetical protein
MDVQRGENEEEGRNMVGQGGRRESRENLTFAFIVTMRSCTARRFKST